MNCKIEMEIIHEYLNNLYKVFQSFNFIYSKFEIFFLILLHLNTVYIDRTVFNYIQLRYISIFPKEIN